MIIPVILILLVLAVLAANIRVVPQSRAFVIERLGAFQGVWGVGLHFKIPFIERVAKNISLKEQVVDFPPQPVITKDNVTMQIDTVIYFQITDPKLYTYGVENPMSAIENLTATTLRNIIGDLELDQSLTSRDHINGQMRSILDEPTAFLDFPSKIETLQMLRRLAHEQHKSILLSTHDVELALQLSDRLWLMEESRFSIGTPKELAADGSLSRFINRDGIRFNKDSLRIEIK